MLTQLKNSYQNFDDILDSKHIKNQCLTHCTDCCYDHYFTTLFEFLLTFESLYKRVYLDLNYYYQKACERDAFFREHLKQETLSINPYTFNSQLSNLFLDHNDLDQHNIKHLPACMMLRNGMCDVYSERPNICRLYGTTIRCEYINNSTYEDDKEIQMAIDHLYQLPEGIRLPLWFWYYHFTKPAHIKQTIALLHQF